MGRARMKIVAEGRLTEAEALWYDTARWSTFSTPSVTDAL